MKTVYHANAILAELANSGVYFGFLSEEPTSSVVYNEVTGNGYERTPVLFTIPADRQIANDTDITVAGNLFNQKIQFAAIFDAPTEGNLLRYYRVDGDEWIVNTVDPLVISAGNFIIRET